MAFPFLVDETWDDGTRGSFDVPQAGTATLDFPSYKELARQGFSPWRGAHALRCRLNGTAVDYIEEGTGFDTALGGTINIWLPVCIGADLTLNDGDTVVIFAMQNPAAAGLVSFGVRRSGSDYQLWAGAASATNTLTITRSNSRWYQVELAATIDSGAANDGTIDFRVDGAPVGSQITGLNQTAVVQARLGFVSGTAAGDIGTILVGGIIADETRVFPRHRFGRDSIWVTRDQTVFVGDGELDSVTISGTGTDAVLTVLDTDIFEAGLTNFSREPIAYMRNVTVNDQSPGLNLPIQFHKGVYVQLTGTNPQAFVTLRQGSIAQSHSNYVDMGHRR